MKYNKEMLEVETFIRRRRIETVEGPFLEYFYREQSQKSYMSEIPLERRISITSIVVALGFSYKAFVKLTEVLNRTEPKRYILRPKGTQLILTYREMSIGGETQQGENNKERPQGTEKQVSNKDKKYKISHQQQHWQQQQKHGESNKERLEGIERKTNMNPKEMKKTTLKIASAKKASNMLQILMEEKSALRDNNSTIRCKSDREYTEGKSDTESNNKCNQ
ncbi:hypothetical protein CHS0354_036346 [Potamilus streckersoni]|uniref:Uncharacterized protein n=1 Tax=Potamilus streckersoni TaxID=2493646 RepID=A0AAE0SF43_9BIVA|nr:hypothetical protein CHS0354_036346 [Potamilus streckersoni]